MRYGNMRENSLRTRLFLIGNKAVTDPWLGKNIPGQGRIGLDLLSEITYENS